MIKVLFLTQNLGGGGAEKVLVNLVNGMDKRKFDMDTTITSLGTYEIKIQLHKGVTAKVKLFVIEE